MKVTFQGERIFLTDHAERRYAERIKNVYNPTFDEQRRFASELSALVERHGVRVEVQPEWVGVYPDDDQELRRADFYIIIGTDVCIPVVRATGLTVLARGTFSGERREFRNARRQAKAASRRARRQHESWLGEKSPRWR